MKVAESAEGVKATPQAMSKPAKLETGLTVQVRSS